MFSAEILPNSAADKLAISDGLSAAMFAVVQAWICVAV